FVNSAYDLLINGNISDVIQTDEHPRDCIDHLKPQFEFIAGDSTIRILRFENISEEIKTYGKEFGINNILPMRNTTEHRHYREYYTEDLKEKVKKMYARD